jgi:hypothetical protein
LLQPGASSQLARRLSENERLRIPLPTLSER